MKPEFEIKNAEIVGTSLGFLSHGVFQFFIGIKYNEGVEQSFGGFGLSDRGMGSIFGCEAIMRTLKTVGVEKWEDLPGKPVRVDASWDEIRRIGHFLEDKWFDWRELVQEIGLEELK